VRGSTGKVEGFPHLKAGILDVRESFAQGWLVLSISAILHFYYVVHVQYIRAGYSHAPLRQLFRAGLAHGVETKAVGI
jgi:hypothetical protein